MLQKAVAPTDRCMGCGIDVFDGGGFCPNCLKNVVFNNGKTCKLCGVAIHGAEDYCSHCAFEKTFYDRCFSPFCYGGCVQRAILNMKFGNIATNAQLLARYLAQCAKSNKIQFDVVTYVPMTANAEKQRGYNQAQLLAQSFCDILKIDEPVALLKKVKDTQRQEKLGKKERKENLVGAFSATTDLHGKVVLVIDDIKTTGSTLNECAKALKKKGATQVICLTVASREENMVWEIDSQS